MRKATTLIIFSLGALGLILILQGFFPKYHSLLIFLLFFLLTDLYLWTSVRRTLIAMKPIFRYPVVALYWLPIFLLVTLVIFGFIVPFLQWNLFLRTQLLSLFFITFLAKIIPILFLVLSDAANLLHGLIRRLKGESPAFILRRRHLMMLAGWITGAFVWIIMLFGMVIWVFDFNVRTVDVPMPNLPNSFNGFRIVQISDVHLGSWTSKVKLQEAVSIINSLKPDVILFTGDMFNYATADGDGFQPILTKLSARHGIISILGNHDYGDYIRWPSAQAKLENMEQLRVWYQNLGWNLLLNQSVILREGNDSIAIIGVENWGAEKRFQKRADMGRALAGVKGVPCKILLSHDPTHWDSIVSKKYPEIGLTLAGHTHGGQFGIETETMQWSPIEWIYQHWGGLYNNLKSAPGSNQYLYVNRGLGTVGYSGRVGIRPEITLIILRK